MDNEIISWLLRGDVSIQYQTYRDLLDYDKPVLQKRIESEGWGGRLLALRKPDGHWGRGFYQPKWTSTHYTLLDLKNLSIHSENNMVRETIKMIFENEKGPDGGLLPIGKTQRSDVCINGMVLNYSAYFHVDAESLSSVVDFLLGEEMNDGGFNCHSNRGGANHSSVHSTLSVIEGILEYERNGYRYRLNELKRARLRSQEFLLLHRLFRSHRTGEVMKPDFLKLYYPCRWYYDILRALDYFRLAIPKYDERMNDATAMIVDKRTATGEWKLGPRHPGQTHFDMEEPGRPSRWNTLRALRILRHFNINS